MSDGRRLQCFVRQTRHDLCRASGRPLHCVLPVAHLPLPPIHFPWVESVEHLGLCAHTRPLPLSHRIQLPTTASGSINRTNNTQPQPQPQHTANPSQPSTPLAPLHHPGLTTPSQTSPRDGKRGWRSNNCMRSGRWAPRWRWGRAMNHPHSNMNPASDVKTTTFNTSNHDSSPPTNENHSSRNGRLGLGPQSSLTLSGVCVCVSRSLSRSLVLISLLPSL